MGHQNPWLALMIGNSHCHWAYFRGNIVRQTWLTNHRSPSEELPTMLGQVPLVLASVVPEQTSRWLAHGPRILTLADLPLGNLYGSLGIDRALAGLGAGLTVGFPCLIIDGGTALTITGFDQNRNLFGGAILPGLGLQLTTLGDRLAALPYLDLPDNLPPRWAMDTPAAMASGVVYGVLEAIRGYGQDWQKLFPDAPVVVTGGDGPRLQGLLQAYLPDLKVAINEHLIFLGMANFQPGAPAPPPTY